MKYPILIAGILFAFVLFQHGVTFQLGGHYFRNQQEQLANSKAQEIAREIAGRLDVLRTGARVIAQRNDEIFRGLLGQPDDRAAAARRARKIITSFPMIEDIGVIDQNGQPSMAGDKTVLDASVARAASALSAADAGSLPVIVQPDAAKSYFYTVAPWVGAEDRRATVVLRFSIKALTQILEPRTIPGHETLLVSVPSSGTASILGGTQGVSGGSLSPGSEVFSRVSARAPVAGTIWQVVVVTQENLHSDFFWMRIRVLSLSASLIVMAILAMLVLVLRRERAHRAGLVALRQSEVRFRQLSDAAFEGIVFFDETAILDANRAAERLLGYGRGEMIGLSFIDLVSPEHRASITKMKEMGPERTGETLALRKDGSMVHVEFASKAIEYEGRPARVAALRDVSERKRLEQMLRDFVANVSHELRTPLTSIRGALGLISGKAVDSVPEKKGQLIEIAYRNAERLTLLVEDILDFEKMASGELSYDFEPMALRTLLTQAMETNASFADGLGAHIQLVDPIPDVLINGDGHRLLQVLTNLISNAAKFSPPDGTVRIRACTEAGEVRVEVTDSGPGVPTHFVDRLFQRFQQAEAPDRTAIGGTGLGLAISKSIIDAHGGEIGYRPGPQGGSIFYFNLPVALKAAGGVDGDTPVSDAA
ncbi:MAG: PAS domain S-box protein [Proteobacteria bacterium]|nr:PAS domain S-box protein [Pseudomonadota bacterium]